MKEISEVTVAVIDTGTFLPFATRMAEAAKRVLFCPPAEITPASVTTGCVGDGFPNIEHCRDFWPHVEDIDLFCFGDCHHSGLQLYLESIGKAVWGARRGDRLELNRELLMGMLQKLGLDVPTFQKVQGLPALRDHLRDKEDKFIKISRFRGDMETFHWRDWTHDEGWIDWLAVRVGPVGPYMTFLVFDKIDTPFEIGADTYSIDGGWPGLMLNGIEGKDKSYFAAVTKREEMPEQIQRVLTAFSPFLESVRYRQCWSMEVRVKDHQSFFGDATTRLGLPSSASQQLLWKNFPEIVWHGANGELIDPEPVANFSIETMVTAKTEPGTWETVVLPPELERNCRFCHCAFIDGRFCFPPDDMHGGDLGWLCATGDTPAETLQEAKRLADLLPDGLNADVEALASVIQEIETMKEKAGIGFTEQEMPEAAEVL